MTFLLLDPSDAAAVNDFLDRHYKAGKYQNNACRSGSISYKSRKSFLYPTGRSGGTASKSVSRRSPDAHIDQPAAANADFEYRQYNDGFCSPAYDAGNDGHMGNEYPDLTDSDDPDNVDPWKPLNPHEPGNLKVKPYKRVKANRMSRVNSKKRHPIMVEFPLARVDGPISLELTNAWEERCALKRQGEPESPSLYEKLRQSLAGKSTKDGKLFPTLEILNLMVMIVKSQKSILLILKCQRLYTPTMICLMKIRIMVSMFTWTPTKSMRMKVLMHAWKIDVAPIWIRYLRA